MRTATCVLSSALLILIATQNMFGEDVLFKDDFKNGLSNKWKVVGLKKTDYRIQNGGLEMRVQPGKLSRNPPMLKVILPFSSTDSVDASVKVTVLDEFTQEQEHAGIYLLDESSPEFRGVIERIDGRLVFAPGNYHFKGKPGEDGEGDPRNYDVKYTAVTKEAGPLRIIVDRGYAFFQVGPSKSGQYMNFFYSAIREEKKERGFALLAAGAPDGAAHWVRFENFRVIKH